MSTAYIVVAGIAALANLAAAGFDLVRPPWLIANMERMDVPQAQLLPLAVLKAAGAIGLIVGIAVPAIGIAAALGLVIFFAAAIATASRADFYEHLPQPGFYFVLALGALVLGIAS